MTAMKLKLGDKVAGLISIHNGFALVVSAALGGGKKSGPPKAGDAGVKELGIGAGTVEDAVAQINSALRV